VSTILATLSYEFAVNMDKEYKSEERKVSIWRKNKLEKGEAGNGVIVVENTKQFPRQTWLYSRCFLK
jgi:hypothetical protein